MKLHSFQLKYAKLWISHTKFSLLIDHRENCKNYMPRKFPCVQLVMFMKPCKQMLYYKYVMHLIGLFV